eukprot:6199978-Pleurochrysis_carterae.AAC.2
MGETKKAKTGFTKRRKQKSTREDLLGKERRSKAGQQVAKEERREELQGRVAGTVCMDRKMGVPVHLL